MTTILPEWLVINSVNLGTHNCKAEDILHLLGGSADGENRRLPRATGRRPYRHWQDEIVETVRIKVRGDVDADGVPIVGSPRAGLATLIQSLRSSLYIPPATTAGTHTAEMHLANGSTLTAQVQVPKFSPVSTGPLSALVVIQVVVPAGVWS